MEFEQIYNTYFNDVYRYIRKLYNNEHNAKEITSETFFKAMNSLESLRNECDFRVWLCQIAKNSYYSYLKRQKKYATLDNIDLINIADPDSSIDEKRIQQAQVIQVQKVLHTLPDPYKEVFMWRVFADLSYKQIAVIFGKTDNWPCVTYHREKIMIKTRLEDYNDEK